MAIIFEKCPECGKLVDKKELIPQPDPYQFEINNDDTDVVQCDECRDQSAMDI